MLYNKQLAITYLTQSDLIFFRQIVLTSDHRLHFIIILLGMYVNCIWIYLLFLVLVIEYVCETLELGGNWRARHDQQNQTIGHHYKGTQVSVWSEPIKVFRRVRRPHRTLKAFKGGGVIVLWRTDLTLSLSSQMVNWTIGDNLAMDYIPSLGEYWYWAKITQDAVTELV